MTLTLCSGIGRERLGKSDTFFLYFSVYLSTARLERPRYASSSFLPSYIRTELVILDTHFHALNARLQELSRFEACPYLDHR